MSVLRLPLAVSVAMMAVLTLATAAGAQAVSQSPGDASAGVGPHPQRIVDGKIVHLLGPDLVKAWRSTGQTAHPLVGRIFNAQTGQTAERMFEPASHAGTLPAQFLLLGEVHDNPDHHALRAGVISRINLGAGIDGMPKAIAIVMEHLKADQAPTLDGLNSEIAASPGQLSASSLLSRLEWDKSGWPKAEMFEPLFAAAIFRRFPIGTGDPSRAMIRKAAKEGSAALPDDERARLRLDAPLPEKLQSALLDELEASHCGLMPRTAFGNMAFAQRYRDAHLAHALVRAADAHGSAILLAGNGHVRTDRGVPLYLKQMAPGRKVVSVLLLEVEEGKHEPEAYIPRDPDGHPAADYIVFTPRAERPDPCEEMRKHFAPKAK